MGGDGVAMARHHLSRIELETAQSSMWDHLCELCAAGVLTDDQVADIYASYYRKCETWGPAKNG